MKTQAKTAACRGKKPRPAGRLPSSTHGRPSRLDSGQPLPAARTPDALAIAEHRRVQREIEERARRLWCAEGSPDARALAHWLAAETEVLAEFVKSRGRQPGPASADPQNSRRETSALPPVIPGPSATRANRNSTAAWPSHL